MRSRSKHGFTLIELLVVVAIIALLVTILMPSLQRVKSIARQVMCLTNQRQLPTITAMYAMDNNDGMPTPREPGVVDPPFSGPSNIVKLKEAGVGRFKNTGHLWLAGYIEDPRVLYCAAQEYRNVLWSRNKPYFETLRSLGDNADVPNIWIAFQYMPHANPDRSMKYPKYDMIPAGALLSVDYIHSLGRQSHKDLAEGWNLVRADSSGEWVADELAWEMMVATDLNTPSSWPIFTQIIEILEGK